MLRHFPHAFGSWLKNIRPGLEKTVYHDPRFAGTPEILEINSPAFEPEGRIPADYTLDGIKISPPLAWQGTPLQARSLVLIVEDADSPTRGPFTHSIITGLSSMDDCIPEGGFRNFGARYLPPDPPPGHGPHHYAFQLFALDRFLHLSGGPTKEAVKEAMAGHLLARGCLIGIYERL